MRLLLDTQIFLWYLDQTARIPAVADMRPECTGCRGVTGIRSTA